MRHLFSLLSIFTLLTTLNAQVPSYVPTNGLVGWWPFNGNANDESGNGNNGTVNGATLTEDRFGVSNAAYNYDGVNDYSSIPNLNVGTSTAYTVSVWVKLETSYSPGFPQHYIRDNGTTVGGLYLNIDSDENQFCCNSIFTNNIIGIWKHYVGIIDGSNYNLYINGLLVGTQSGCNSTFIDNTLLLIGKSNVNTEYANATIDDIGIWNRALTPAEIQALYTAQPLTPCISPDPVSFTGLNSSYTTSDGPVTLTGTPAGGVFIGPGVTGSTFAPAVAGEGTHSIQYVTVDGDGCVNSAGLCTSVALGMLVEPGPDALGGVSVFPNPNRGQFTVELELSGLVSLQVFDARGALVHNEVFTASGARTQRMLDLSTLAKGSYTLQVQNSGGVVNQKVVVE